MDDQDADNVQPDFVVHLAVFLVSSMHGIGSQKAEMGIGIASPSHFSSCEVLSFGDSLQVSEAH